jgi:hypothetical protein
LLPLLQEFATAIAKVATFGDITDEEKGFLKPFEDAVLFTITLLNVDDMELFREAHGIEALENLICVWRGFSGSKVAANMLTHTQDTRKTHARHPTRHPTRHLTRLQDIQHKL